ncbi:MAG: DMT family transporter [Desulfomicrobium sp.]|nr:DMT family transporter [Desulfomicrobium sp.]
MTFISILPFLSLFVGMVLWGSSFVAFKYAVMFFDPIVVVFARMIISALLFLLVLPLWRPRNLRREDLGFMVFMALCEPCFYFVFEGQALTMTSASQAGMVAATLPVLVAVCAGFFLGERLSARSWSGLVLALAGVIWVSVSGVATESSPRPLMGNFLELLAMLCAAGYTVSMKKLCARYSPWFLTAVQSLVGTVFFLPLLFLPSTALPVAFPVGPSLAVLYLCVCISIGAYGLYNYGISKLPAWQASAFVNLIPVFSMLLGWLCLGEQLTAWQLVGVAVVFAGVLLCQQWPDRQSTSTLSRKMADEGVRAQHLPVSDKAFARVRDRGWKR